MTVEQLMDAIEEIDDSYIAKYTRGLPKRSQIHWGLISAAACFCLMVSSVIFVLSAGLLPGFPDTSSKDIHDAWQYVYYHGGTLSENGYYYLDYGSYLRYVDINTGENRILCSTPYCDHDSANCDAYIDTMGRSIFYHRGYLYYYSLCGSFCRRDADGRNEIALRETGNAKDGRIIALSDHYLYYTNWIAGSANGSREHRVMRMNLTTGTSQLLWSKEMAQSKAYQQITLLAVQDAGVMFLWSEGAESDAEAKTAPMHITYWDSATGTSTDLLEKPREELLEVRLVEDGKLYFIGMGKMDGNRPDTVVYDLTTGKEKTAFKNVFLRTIGGGYGILSEDGDTKSVVHLSSGEKIPTDAVQFGAYAVTADSEGVVLRQTIQSVENPGDVTEEILYYLPYAAMADGIQESDLVKLYSFLHDSGDYQ